jgi:regulator of sirC expression with transglutaminase-like and TPR domain
MTHLETFSRLVGGGSGDARFPLLESAVALAQYADEAYEPGDVVNTVRGWGERLRARIAQDTSALNRLRMLNHFFFDELAFRPNRADYYDADNSYLHRVVERRLGIPITLSVLYIEIGRAINLRLFGVGFPGHFLVKMPVAEGALFIDVFERGATLSAEQLRERLQTALRRKPAYPLEIYLRAASEREIVARMLRNLKSIHVDAEDWTALLEVQNRLIALLPDAAEERRDRSLAFERLECPRAAADDLVAYLSMHPDPRDAVQVRARLSQLQRAAQRLN